MTMIHDRNQMGYLGWQVALATAAVVGSLATACMMPFVAIAVATAATMSRPRAAATVGAAWATNQLLGFTLLGYPPTLFAIAWGAALGGASILAMVVAGRLIARRALSFALLWTAFAASFAAFEASLYAFSLIAGGSGTFTPTIIVKLLANDGVWLAALALLHVILTRAAPRMFGPPLIQRAL